MTKRVKEHGVCHVCRGRRVKCHKYDAITWENLPCEACSGTGRCPGGDVEYKHTQSDECTYDENCLSPYCATCGAEVTEDDLEETP